MSKTATTIREDDLALDSSGRVYVDDDVFDIGDQTQAVLIVDESTRKHFPATIISKHRITIPHRFRRDHDLDTGDEVDIEITIP